MTEERPRASRVAPLVLLTLVTLAFGCGKTRLAPASTGAEPSSSSSSIVAASPRQEARLLPFNADDKNLLPASRPGFTACSPDFGLGITIEQGRATLAAWRARPRAPLLHAHPATVRRSMQTLSFVSATGRGVVTLDDSLKSVHVTGADIGAVLRSKSEWDPDYDDLVSGILPAEALIALASDDERTDKFSAHAYLIRENAEETSRALLATGAETARAIGCSQEEDGFHRASYRVYDSSAGAARKIQVTVSLYDGCTSDDAQVDMRIVADFVGGTLVLACLERRDNDEATCDALAASVRRKR